MKILENPMAGQVSYPHSKEKKLNRILVRGISLLAIAFLTVSLVVLHLSTVAKVLLIFTSTKMARISGMAKIWPPGNWG